MPEMLNVGSAELKKIAGYSILGTIFINIAALGLAQSDTLNSYLIPKNKVDQTERIAQESNVNFAYAPFPSDP